MLPILGQGCWGTTPHTHRPWGTLSRSCPAASLGVELLAQDLGASSCCQESGQGTGGGRQTARPPSGQAFQSSDLHPAGPTRLSEGGMWGREEGTAQAPQAECFTDSPCPLDQKSGQVHVWGSLSPVRAQNNDVPLSSLSPPHRPAAGTAASHQSFILRATSGDSVHFRDTAPSLINPAAHMLKQTFEAMGPRGQTNPPASLPGVPPTQCGSSQVSWS